MAGVGMKRQLLVKSVDPGIIQRFAPKIYLHPYDKNHPDSVENYFKTVYLMSGENVPLATTVTADILQDYNEASNYLRFADDRFPTAADDFATGAAIQATQQPHIGETTAPVYVKTFTYTTHIDLKYIFFYPLNGFQVFRVGILHIFATKKRNFEWARFARHEGDWEHVTVRLDASGQKLLGVFYGQHGDSVWVEDPPLVDDTHPVVMSALNSHASYPTSETFTLDTILNPPGLSPIGWLKAADTTSIDALVTYDPPQPLYSVVQWVPYANANQLIILDNNPDAEKWLSFKGRWGPPNLDNTHIDCPPPLPEDTQDDLFNWAKIGQIFIPSKYLYGDGPVSPQQQGWWNQKEP